MRLPPTGANGLETRDWEGFKQDVNDFFVDLFSPVCTKFPKTLGCPKPQPEPEPEPAPPATPDPITPNPPNPPSNPGNGNGNTPPVTTTRASNPAPTTPPANPPPAATTTPAPVIPAPVVPAPQPTPAPGNGNDDGNGNGNDGDGNGNDDDNGNGGGGNGGGNTDPGSGGSNPSPTRGGEAANPRPTTTRAGQGQPGRPQNLGGNVLLVASGTASGPRPTSFADSQSGVSDELGINDDLDDPAPEPVFGNNSNGPGPGRVLIDNDSGSQAPSPKPTGGSDSGLEFDDGTGSGSSGNNGGGFNGGGISGGDSGGGGGSTSTSPNNTSATSSPLPGIIGAVVSLLVLLLILLALLYKYRRTRRVQSFLIKFTPLKIAPYSKLDRKRSSMGSDLMFGCRGEQEPYTDEKRPWSLNYGSMDAAPPVVTQPNPAARRSHRTDAPPVLELNISLANSVRSASPTSEFEPSPLSPSFPNMRTPPPAKHSPRSSQDTVGGFSIASSGVFNPSSITWPIPPSTANSVGSPPGTANTYDTGPIIVGRSTPTRYKPIQPAPPSNWQRPQDWE